MASTTTKTVASVATAAAVIAGGIGVYEYYDDNSIANEMKSTEIDWSKYDLNIPTITLPTIYIPSIQVVAIPTVNVPKLDDLNLTPLSMPTIEKNNVVDKAVNNNAVVQKVDKTTATVTKATKIDTSISNAVINEIQLKKLNATTSDFSNQINKNSITLEKLPNPANDLPAWFAFVEKQQKIFIDQRNLQYDKTFIKSNKIVNDWIEIYNQYKNMTPVAYIPITKKFRMITEVRVAKTYKELDILKRNLKYYKSEGYDTVLFGFDKDDTVSNALNTVKYIQKYCDMKVWFTYTGKESLHDTVFIAPNKYKEILTALAPYCNGYLNSWRRTSAHLWEQDMAFMNYTNSILRKAAPNIPIVGELYYGNTHKYDQVGMVGFGLNNFENSSAVMIVNFGFRKIDMKYLFNNILKPYIGNSPKIGCVVGQKPYYMGNNDNGLSYQDNMLIKHEIENKFFNNGCIGTVTLSNDGHAMETNNITITPYDSLNANSYIKK